MRRKLTGSSLALVLIAIIAVKHVAMGFCLCTHEFFISDCPCSCEAEPVPAPCPCEEHDAPAEAPCDDCTIPINLDVGDFLWAADPFSPPSQDANELAVPNADFQDHWWPGTPFGRIHLIRGAPPSGPPPHLLRTTVFRL